MLLCVDSLCDTPRGASVYSCSCIVAVSVTVLRAYFVARRFLEHTGSLTLCGLLSVGWAVRFSRVVVGSLWLHVLRSVQVCTMLLPYFVVCIVVVV